MENNNKSKKIIVLIIIAALIICLPIAGLIIANRDRDDYCNMFITTRNNEKNIMKKMNENRKKLENKLFSKKTSKNMETQTSNIKVFTKNIEDGLGKIQLEISKNDEKEIFEFDIKYDEDKWVILNPEIIGEDNEENKEKIEIVDKIKENLNNCASKNISLSYEYSMINSKSKD